MQTPTSLRKLFSLLSLLTLSLANACGHPENSGYYLSLGTTQDIGMLLGSVMLWGPLPGRPPVITDWLTGYLYTFPAGDAFPDRRFTFPRARYDPDGSFTLAASNDADPGDVSVIRAHPVPSDPGDDTGAFRGTVRLDGTVRAFTMARVGYGDYDDYKCWNGGGSCPPALSAPVCSFTPDGPGTYAVHASLSWRDADGNLSSGSILVGFRNASGDYACGFPFSAGTQACYFGAFSVSLTGTTDGTITVDSTGLALPADQDEMVFQVADGDPNIQHTDFVGCDLP